ncbi:transposase-like protein [Corynebacterium diphtheriae DSM 43988]|nr:transposase-like protein [Corynebacterium diphtheriae DSM 43988]
MADLLAAADTPRATFFYHQTRLDKPDKHAAVKHAILESFEANKHRYGYRRVLLDLRNKGWVVNHKLVYTLMHQMGLRPKSVSAGPIIPPQELSVVLLTISLPVNSLQTSPIPSLSATLPN